MVAAHMYVVGAFVVESGKRLCREAQAGKGREMPIGVVQGERAQRRDQDSTSHLPRSDGKLWQSLDKLHDMEKSTST